jgi:putative oxygen-independent coproporphyrinogen III oxidase
MSEGTCAPPKTLVSPDCVLSSISEAVRARRNKRLLVYIHVPFCTSKCHFCDWVVRYPTQDLIATGELQDGYVQALCNQIRWYGPRLEALGYQVTNVYWGGGTPTRLQPEHLTAITGALAEGFKLDGVVEHTLECSPESVTAEKLQALIKGGLNRISVGVQSFNPEVLRGMGRAHTADRAREAIGLIRDAGIENINIDLIAGYADDTLESMIDSLHEAARLQIPHLSVYLFRTFNTCAVSVKQILKGFRKLDASNSYECLDAVKRTLEQAGYEQYTLGCYAREPRFYFDAELHYYTHRGDYIGFGAGGESFLGQHSVFQSPLSGGINVRDFIRDPLSMGFMCHATQLVGSESASRAVLQALSTKGGLSYSLWKDQFGIDPGLLVRIPAVVDMLNKLRAAGARVIETPDGLQLEALNAMEAVNRFQANEREMGHNETVAGGA